MKMLTGLQLSIDDGQRRRDAGGRAAFDADIRAWVRC
jgi:hypothetical protein